MSEEITSKPPDVPLLAGDQTEDVQTPSAVQLTAPPPEEEGDIVELGDRVLILGGRLHFTRGRVYYRDFDMIRILPDGVSDRLVDIPFVDGDPDPDLGVEEFVILEKRKLYTFTQLMDLQPDQFIETFKKDVDTDGSPFPGPSFTVLSVNTNIDRAVFVDETNQEFPLDFKYFGIPLDAPFVVLRTRAPLKELAEAVESAEISAKAAPAPEATKPLFQILGTLEVPKIPEITEIPTSERIYPDIIQRSDMIQDLLRLKTAAQQKNPRTLIEIRRLVEICILLRNDVVKYAPTGQPIGEKATSVSTLIELLESGLPMAKPVLDAVRLLFVDTLDDQAPTSKDVDGVLLASLVKKSIEYLDPDKMNFPAPTGQTSQKPAWITAWQGYVDTYFRSWKSGGLQPNKLIKSDGEFFMKKIPVYESPEAEGEGEGSFEKNLDGLQKLVYVDPVKKKITIIDQNKKLSMANVDKIPFSIRRGLGPRRGRPTVSRGVEIVTSGEEAAILNYILFPFDTIRMMGPTRSGNLLMDSLRSQQPPMTYEDVIRSKDGITEIPTADSILSVGPMGTTTGNIDVFEYLKRVPLQDVKGFGDFEDLFIALGLDKFEVNVEQLGVLEQMLQEAEAIRLEAIRKLRESSEEDLKSEKEIVQRPFSSSPEDTERLLSLFLGAPDLNKALSRLRGMTPIYEKVDLAQMAFLIKFFPDYVNAVVSGKPIAIARERVRAARDAFQERLRIIYLENEKEQKAGAAPIPNNCPHVRAWEQIQKVDDSTDRMRLTNKFVGQFRGKDAESTNYFSCIVCNQNLICKHEFLLLQEFLHPQESQVLHKEILLNYSGGQFQGKYICKVCGQPISEIEYDDSLEYDDEGRPMIGRSVLVDQDAIEQENEEILFGAPVETEDDIDFKIAASEEGYKFRDVQFGREGENKPSTVAQTIYLAAKQIYARLGVQPTKESYVMVVQKTHNDLLKLTDRKRYMKQMEAQIKEKGTKVGMVEYDVYVNRRLVGLTANYCLIDIQTHIPDYLIFSTLPGCRATFQGYPKGAREELGAIEYLSCVVASITRDRAPWNMTGWLREGQDKKRIQMIMKYLDPLMENMLSDATIQQIFVQKQTYEREVLGKVSGEEGIREMIPSSFLPAPVKNQAPTEGEAIEEAAATGDMQAQAWILRAHKEAKRTALLVENSPYTETSCCFADIQKPADFWQSNGFESAGSTIPGGSKGSRLVVPFEARKLPRIVLEAPEAAYSSVFLKVCFRGPRIGLPHEPGYTHYCPYCDFQFPGDPTTMDPDEGKEALLTQQIPVTPESFQEVLDATHLRYEIPPFRLRRTIDQTEFLLKLRDMNPAPYSDWQRVIQACLQELSKLPQDADEITQATAWTPLLEREKFHSSALRARTNEDIVRVLTTLGSLSPKEVKSQLTTYFITPFNRALQNFQVGSLETVLTDYEVSEKHKEDIKKFLREHLNALQMRFDEAFVSPLIRARAEEFVNRLHNIVNILSNLRVSLVVFGGERIIQYIIRSMIFGSVYEYSDLNRVPPNFDGSGAAEDSVAGVRKSLEVLQACTERYRREAKKFSDQEVRELITARNEKEKLDFVNQIKKMTKEMKQIELTKKKLGLGKWAVGGTKLIYAYDKDRYDYEREERAAAGIVDFPGQGPEDAMAPTGRQVGADGFHDYGADYEREGGYETNQMQEDDY